MENEKRAAILIVDDVEMNRILLEDMLDDSYNLFGAENGLEALSFLKKAESIPDLILLDVVMPEMGGFETLKHIKADANLKNIPVIFITAEIADEAKGLSSGAVDYIIKPFEPEVVRMRVSTQIELARHRNHLEHMVEEKAAELISTKEVFLETMADLIECRSAESGQHVKRTKELSRILISQLLKKGPYINDLRNTDCEAMVKAVPLHDIGKISILDDILLKPGKLTDEEFEIIKTHTIEGSKIIDSLIAKGINDAYIRHCHDICLYHHERWDGRGYPMGIANNEIPLSARIVALVDVYDALVSDRCYRKAMSHEEALKIILDSSGSHFDPAVVDAFIVVQEDFKKYECIV